jgi:hypothetical protein
VQINPNMNVLLIPLADALEQRVCPLSSPSATLHLERATPRHTIEQ